MTAQATERVLRSDRVVRPSGPAAPGWVRLRGETVVDVGAGDPPAVPDAPVEDLGEDWLAPGFVDLHVHGGGGRAFTEGAEAARRVVAAHRAHGTTTTMASLVTDTLDALEQQVRELVPLVQAGELAGIHLEGPWLASSRCGAHDPELLQAPAPADVERLLRAGQGHVRMVTLAPELPGGLDAVALLRARGVIAAVGHTEASDQVVQQAVQAGATVGTHLFNAMPSIHHRAPGPIPRLLTDPRVAVELIADGVHVEPSVLAMAVSAARGRWMLMTDAMAATGCPDGAYRLGPLDVDVVDAVARIRGTGAIAGSTLTLDRAVRLMVEQVGVPPEEALRAASRVPAQVLGRDDLGRLAPGVRADLVVLGADWSVRRVIGGGVDR